MTDFNVKALARKWAEAYTDSGPELLLVGALAAAIREALEEAEKSTVHFGRSCSCCTITAARIAALSEGRHEI